MTTITTPTKGKQGFASMDPEKRRAICRKGALALHEKGKAHRWTREQAGLAGRVGGKVRSRQMKRNEEEVTIARGE
jgi:hypothetical protein